MTLLFAVLACFGLALVAPAIVRGLRGGAAVVLALLPAGLTIVFASLLPAAADGAASFFLAWVPQLNLNLSLRADGLSLLLALLISGVGTLVMVYAGAYLQGHRDLPRFMAWLLVFMGAMLGVVLASNLLLLYVFWELTSISSYFLIAFEHEKESARRAALQALLVTSGGGLAMLGGLLLLGQAAGSLELAGLLDQAEAVRAHPLYLPALVLILLGAFTKSAQFPFHFWLPNAMEAPTPVSAYLHSATMVKAGVYLLARLSPVLGGTPAWEWGVGGVGLATLLAGGWLALGQTDLKRLLAYSTVSALGFMVLLLGLHNEAATVAALVFLLGHALYKGALFMAAGALDHETGTRDVSQLGGLLRVMPVLGAASILAALSFAGLPPLFGFIGKELGYAAALDGGWALTAAVVVGSLFFVYAAFVAGLEPFVGGRPRAPRLPRHPLPVGLWLGPVVLAVLGLLLGLFPAALAGRLAEAATAATLGRPAEVELALWHGFNLPLGLSALTVALGLGLYLARGRVRALARRLTWRWGPEWAFEAALAGLLRLARGQTRVLQSGYLRYYLLIIFITTTGLATFTLVSLGGMQWPLMQFGLTVYEAALAALVLAGAGIAVTARSRLASVAALGMTGYGVALIYLVFGAPDLAMTQFLVESLTVILFVLVFYHLPQFSRLSPRNSLVRDAVVALLSGGLMTALVLSAIGLNWFPSITEYFAENAVPGGHGRNVVNVILVDFRGLDTLGEITVLSIAALGVFALLKLGPGADK